MIFDDFDSGLASLHSRDILLRGMESEPALEPRPVSVVDDPQRDAGDEWL